MRARNKRENVLQSQQCYRHSGIAGSSVMTEKKLSCRSFFCQLALRVKGSQGLQMVVKMVKIFLELSYLLDKRND